MNSKGFSIGDEPQSDQRMTIEPYPLDEQILSEAAEREDTLILIERPLEKSIVLGRSSRPGEELNLESCREDNIKLYRRRGGGCSVYLDEGTLNLSVVLLGVKTLDIMHLFGCFSQWMIHLLGRQGFSPIYRAGTSDLVMHNRKIAGSCLYRRHSLVLYSVSLLICTQVELMERYLRHPPREPSYRDGRTHRDFVRPLLAHFGLQESRLEIIFQNLSDDAQKLSPQLIAKVTPP